MFKIDCPPPKKLALIITIPCYNEPDLLSSLMSLYSCDTLDDNYHVEVLVVINASEDSTEKVKNNNKFTYDEAIQWKETHQKEGISFYFHLENNLPKKHAGVGLARRMAMDTAYDRFEKNNHTTGVIVCYDADSKCDTNYLTAIHQHFLKNKMSPGCSIYFEHPTNGKEFSQDIYEAIVNYETHLRYYNLAVRYTGYPGAYHTVGSSMAVRANAYKKQGGMNKRKAGEDFYFLHKIIALGNFTELNSTQVIPSPRSSDRVPFGTGRAVQEIITKIEEEYQSYSFQSFEDLKLFFDHLPLFYSSEYDISNMPISIQSFLLQENLDSKINEFHKNSSNYPSFAKRFFAWFNAFRILKFVHFCRDNYYENNMLANEIILFESKIEFKNTDHSQLEWLRKLDRSANFKVKKWIN